MSQITPLAGKQAVLLNRGLFFAKLYYLFFYIANGSLAAFFNVYLEQQRIRWFPNRLAGQHPLFAGAHR